MNRPITQQASKLTRWAWLILLALMVLVYSGALRAGFFLDDTQAVLLKENATNLRLALQNSMTSDRGLVTLSFAINHAINGAAPWGYHLANLVIHYFNGLLLFALLYATLQLPRVGMSAQRASRLALSAAAVSLIHPLGSQAVIYVVQRAELMASTMVLFCALALVCSERDVRRQRLWQGFCVLGSFLGMQCKLIAIVIPLLLLVFDWLLVAKSGRDIWGKRRWMYVGVFASWGMFFVVGAFGLLSPDAQLSSAGAGLTQAIPPQLYLAAQSQILLYYLYVSVWPQTLVFDHVWPLPVRMVECWPTLLVMMLLFGLTVILVIKRVRWAILPTLFFLILAPTSSFLPVLDLAVEHRMYLALSGVCVGVVLLLGRVLARKSAVMVGIMLLLVTALSVRTWIRVGDYQDAQVLWGKVLTVYPESARAKAQVNRAQLMKQGLGKQIRQLYRAIEINPNDDQAIYALGHIYFQLADFKLARPLLEQAWELNPTDRDYTQTLARMLRIDGELERAMDLYDQLIKKNPRDVSLRLALAELLAGMQRWDDALAQLNQAQAISPDNPSVFANTANILLRADRPQLAIEPAKRAYDLAGPQSNAVGVLASAYAANGMWAQARDLFEKMHQQQPQAPATLQRLAWLYATCPDASVQDGPRAVQYARQFFEMIGGASPTTWDTLAAAWARVGKYDQAIDAMHKAIQRLETVDRKDLIPAYQDRLDRYEQSQPYTQK